MKNQSITEFEKIKSNLESKLARLELERKIKFPENQTIISDIDVENIEVVISEVLDKKRKTIALNKILYSLVGVVLILIALLYADYSKKSRVLKENAIAKIIIDFEYQKQMDSIELVEIKKMLIDTQNQRILDSIEHNTTLNDILKDDTVIVLNEN